jgi:hypothetical protein
MSDKRSVYKPPKMEAFGPRQAKPDKSAKFLPWVVGGLLIITLLLSCGCSLNTFDAPDRGTAKWIDIAQRKEVGYIEYQSPSGETVYIVTYNAEAQKEIVTAIITSIIQSGTGGAF